MHIFYDNEVFMKQRYGGVSRYFFEIISKMFQERDMNISVYLGVNDTGYDFQKIRHLFKNFYSRRVKGVHKLQPFFRPYNNWLFNKTVKTVLPDLLHKTYYSPMGLGYKGKKIVTIHDMTHEIYPSFFSKGDAHSAMKKVCAEKADGIICVSKTTQKDLINIFNIPEEKTCAIYHGNSLRLNVTKPAIINEPYILFVGQRWGYKNFNMLLTAYANNKKFNSNFKLICFGGGSFDKSELLYIYEKNIEDKIIHISGGDEKLANLYKYASVLVYPSYYEGFGFPPIEAMHYGCPVLASEFSSIPEVVANAGLYFNPYYMDDLIYKLELILSDSGLRKQLILEGYEQEKKFSWDEAAAQTFNFYKKILN